MDTPLSIDITDDELLCLWTRIRLVSPAVYSSRCQANTSPSAQSTRSIKGRLIEPEEEGAPHIWRKNETVGGNLYAATKASCQKACKSLFGLCHCKHPPAIWCRSSKLLTLPSTTRSNKHTPRVNPNCMSFSKVSIALQREEPHCAHAKCKSILFNRYLSTDKSP